MYHPIETYLFNLCFYIHSIFTVSAANIMIESRFKKKTTTINLPKLRVRLTWLGYWTPSNIVSDCHHVWLWGSCKSVRYRGSWSPALFFFYFNKKNVWIIIDFRGPGRGCFFLGFSYNSNYLQTSQLFRFEYPVWTQKSWSPFSPHVLVDSIWTANAAFSNSGMHLWKSKMEYIFQYIHSFHLQWNPIE